MENELSAQDDPINNESDNNENDDDQNNDALHVLVPALDPVSEVTKP